MSGADLATIGLAEAAAAAGLSAERFRKIWRTVPGFPAPIRAPGPNRRGLYAWRAQSVLDWQLARERVLGAGQAPPANDHAEPRKAHASAVQRQRAAMARMMGGA